MNKEQQTRSAYCNNCAGECQHDILFSRRRPEHDGRDEDGRPNWIGDRHQLLLQCLGCSELRLLDLLDEGFEQHETYTPPRAPRPLPAWTEDVRFADDDIAFVPPLVREIYGALQHGYLRLAACGVRALIEQIAVQQNAGDQGSFAKNIGELRDRGGLSADQYKRVMTVIDAGSATIHRGHVPTQEDVVTMLAITEHIVAGTYLHPPAVEALASRTPARAPRPPKDSKK